MQNQSARPRVVGIGWALCGGWCWGGRCGGAGARFTCAGHGGFHFGHALDNQIGRKRVGRLGGEGRTPAVCW